MGSSRCRGIGRHNTHPASSGRCALPWHNTLDPASVVSITGVIVAVVISTAGPLCGKLTR